MPLPCHAHTWLFCGACRVAAIATRHVSQIGGFSRAKDESRARFPQVRATIACARESRRGESRGRTGSPSAAKTGATRARNRIPARLGLRPSIDRQMPRLGTAMDPAAVGDLAVGTGTHAPPRPRRKKSWLSVFKSKDRLSRGASHDQTAFSARRIVSARRLCRQSAELQTGWRCLGRFDLLVALERTIARKDAALSAAEFKSAKGWKAEDARVSRSRRRIERELFCSHGCSPRTTPRRTAGRARCAFTESVRSSRPQKYRCSCFSPCAQSRGDFCRSIDLRYDPTCGLAERCNGRKPKERCD
jgi:hypothetical protein